MGSVWKPAEPSQPVEDVEMEEEEEIGSDKLSEMSVESEHDEEPDITLANATLFIRDALWWREVCDAIATGDTGRVWEVLKVSKTDSVKIADD